ncbi:MAG: hypothetical protein HON14_15830 [Rhodospirillaceae bacterium]|mgnify:CR=1 FL=1|nr:hypothetical protein [Rhodospirillaceae bacterium]MBT4589192.1 hypothetical protein [Rhodospirillaceae bacterium]MBT4940606.1 hypothetical protein [Rhodospirillaceae bacterium]MBT5941755.1 hypothetical protein [Rhodospirillaceae bacterium]MBT7267665.1 hypothetical protein [Rhodospirillaceae bacterium]
MTAQIEKLGQSTLLIVGHGRSDSPDSTTLIQRHADTITKRGIFKEVKTGFLKIAPFMADQLKTIESEIVYVVPCFASPGSLTKTVIPKELGLTGKITERGGQKILFGGPIGNHPMIAQRLQELVQETVNASELSGQDTTMIVLGHGSSHNPQSEIDTQTIADQIDELNLAQHVIALFLDQKPNLADWQEHCGTQNVIIISHLFSGGAHETVDVPTLLGIDPELTKDRLISDLPIGPIVCEGHTLWLCPSIGADQIVPDVIIERVLELNQL